MEIWLPMQVEVQGRLTTKCHDLQFSLVPEINAGACHVFAGPTASICTCGGHAAPNGVVAAYPHTIPSKENRSRHGFAILSSQQKAVGFQSLEAGEVESQLHPPSPAFPSHGSGNLGTLPPICLPVHSHGVSHRVPHCVSDCVSHSAFHCVSHFHLVSHCVSHFAALSSALSLLLSENIVSNEAVGWRASIRTGQLHAKAMPWWGGAILLLCSSTRKRCWVSGGRGGQ